MPEGKGEGVYTHKQTTSAHVIATWLQDILSCVHKKLSKRCETHNCNWTMFVRL